VPQDIIGVAPGRQRYAKCTKTPAEILDDLMSRNFGKQRDLAHMRDIEQAGVARVCRFSFISRRCMEPASHSRGERHHLAPARKSSVMEEGWGTCVSAMRYRSRAPASQWPSQGLRGPYETA